MGKTTIATLKEAAISTGYLNLYLEDKAQNHKNYKVYADSKKVGYWISQSSIYLSDGKHWNDKFDRMRFNKEQSEYVNFGTCFSFSKSENVAMWMLYGGKGKDGAMVDFRQTHIAKILKTGTIYLGFWENDEFKEITVLSKKDFEIRIADVLYFSENADGTCDIKRSDESVGNINKARIEALNQVRKSYPWNYENECRLIVTIKKELIPQNAHALRIDIGDTYTELLKSKRIYRAPNNQTTKEFTESKLAFEIDWDLCYLCNYKDKQEKKGKRKQLCPNL